MKRLCEGVRQKLNWNCVKLSDLRCWSLFCLHCNMVLQVSRNWAFMADRWWFWRKRGTHGERERPKHTHTQTHTGAVPCVRVELAFMRKKTKSVFIFIRCTSSEPLKPCKTTLLFFFPLLITHTNSHSRGLNWERKHILHNSGTCHVLVWLFVCFRQRAWWYYWVLKRKKRKSAERLCTHETTHL